MVVQSVRFVITFRPIQLVQFNCLFQLSKIIDCQLTSQGELDFDFDYGACNTFNLEENENETALLCFDQTNSQICHWFDGKKSSIAPWTSNTHRFTLGLASYKGQPLTTGSDYPPHRFTEVSCYTDDTIKLYILNLFKDFELGVRGMGRRRSVSIYN